MIQWTAEALRLDLKYTWKISRNATDEKNNLIIRVSDGTYTGTGEAAPNIRYNETPERLRQQFDQFRSAAALYSGSVTELNILFDTIGADWSLRFGIESAWHQWQAAKKHIPLREQLGLEAPGAVSTSYTVPIMDPGKMKSFYEELHLRRFPFIKLKIDAESGYDCIQELLRIDGRKFMIDANEAFPDAETAIRFLEKIRRLPVELVEQLLPSALFDDAVYLKKYAPFPLFADESILHEADFSKLKQMTDGVNIKLMKAGGFVNGIRLLREARQHGLRTMVGCMVETTVGIAAGVTICSLADYADLDSFLLIKDEPFGWVQEQEGKLILRDPSTRR